jgi:hypothetical protein
VLDDVDARERRPVERRVPLRDERRDRAPRAMSELGGEANAFVDVVVGLAGRPIIR